MIYKAYPILAILLSMAILFSSMLTVSAENDSWDCPGCGRIGNKGNFCGSCGQPRPQPTSTPPSGFQFQHIQTGAYITFGSYPQTAEGNDNTPIEWLVLDVQGKKALLISRYALDCQKYNREYTDITWEKCTLRTWLKETFMKKAFSKTQQKAILTTKVDNSKSQNVYGNGVNTQDKIFLLSYTEALKYFADDNARRCAATEYAKKRGGVTSSYYFVAGKATCAYWLRSPGNSIRDCYTRVGNGGSTYTCPVNSDSGCIRPAIWVDLNQMDK